MRGATHMPVRQSGMPYGKIDDAIVSALVGCHAHLRHLLDCAEDVADNLPDPPRTEACDRLCRELAQAVAIVAAQQDRFFGDTLQIADALPQQRALVARVRGWRSADTLHLRDTIVALRRFAGSSIEEECVAADTLGYMLRCSFDGLRRLLDHAELAVLWLAGARLSDSARGLLQAAAARDVDVAASYG